MHPSRMLEMDASLDKLKQILKQEIGLDASTVGDGTIKKILGQRMRACKVTSIDDYYNYLASHYEELADLLETAVIPETWFFRDTRPFGFILQHIQQRLDKYLVSPCNILSIPCATGEEPYSLAMHLLAAGIPARAFKIQAVDISQRALDIAAHGYFGNNSFRGKTEQKYIDGFFSVQDDQYVIVDAVRQCVNFCRVNILDSGNLPYNNFFDFILCRNLLIYFDTNSKKIAFGNLHRCLKQEGILYIGHSEFGAIPRELFVNTGAEQAFGLIKQSANAVAKNLPAIKNTKTALLPQTPATSARPAAAKKPFAKSQSTGTPPPAVEINPVTQPVATLLESARQFADQGKLQDAEECCYQHIEKFGDDSESFFLLGLINASTGNHDTAENFYRKALYLDPKHYQTLVHLALLLEQRGDSKNAGLMRQRAERALKK